jgi:hypothetical protein
MSKKKRSPSAKPKKKTALKKSRQRLGTRNEPPKARRKVRGSPEGKKGNPHKQTHRESTLNHKRSTEENTSFLNRENNITAIIRPDSASLKEEPSTFDSPSNQQTSARHGWTVILYQTFRPHIEISIAKKSKPTSESLASSKIELWRLILLLIGLATVIVPLITELIKMTSAVHLNAATPTQSAAPLPTWTVGPSPTSSMTSTSSPSLTATFTPSPTDTSTSIATGISAEISTSVPTIPPTLPIPTFGQLNVCILAGTGVQPGQLFKIKVDNTSYSMPAGKADNSSCIIAGEFPVNTQVTIQEIVPNGYLVTDIKVNPERCVVSKDVSLGIVVVKIRRGEIEVTLTNKANDLPTSTPTGTASSTATDSPMLTPSATGTLYPSTTPTVGTSITPPPPITSIPTDTILPTVIYTPTQPPTITSTSEPVDHQLSVDSKRSCKGWEVIAEVSPPNAQVDYIPAQSGKWNREKELTVIVTARWPDGIIKTEEITIRKPDCDD